MLSRQRAYLTGLANGLNPIFQVGKASLTPELTESIREAFNTRELLKIGVLKNCADDPKEIAEMVAGRTHSQVVQVIGKKIILYKPDKNNPKIVLPTARARGNEKEKKSGHSGRDF
ncbi:MAG: ribosome assembly RNA-binding protein YhbY [Clostridium sp.]|jgi:RNA-binding protein|nr:ribosome assembly RNA-binding protein YhbY [Clostridium sp.]